MSAAAAQPLHSVSIASPPRVLTPDEIRGVLLSGARQPVVYAPKHVVARTDLTPKAKMAFVQLTREAGSETQALITNNELGRKLDRDSGQRRGTRRVEQRKDGRTLSEKELAVEARRASVQRRTSQLLKAGLIENVPHGPGPVDRRFLGNNGQPMKAFDISLRSDTGAWQMPVELVSYSALTEGAKFLYVVRGAHARKSGESFISRVLGEKYLGCSAKSLYTYDAELVKAGFIRDTGRTRGKGRTKVYELLYHPLFEARFRGHGAASPEKDQTVFTDGDQTVFTDVHQTVFTAEDKNRKIQPLKTISIRGSEIDISPSAPSPKPPSLDGRGAGANKQPSHLPDEAPAQRGSTIERKPPKTSQTASIRNDTTPPLTDFDPFDVQVVRHDLPFLFPYIPANEITGNTIARLLNIGRSMWRMNGPQTLAVLKDVARHVPSERKGNIGWGYVVAALRQHRPEEGSYLEYFAEQRRAKAAEAKRQQQPPPPPPEPNPEEQAFVRDLIRAVMRETVAAEPQLAQITAVLDAGARGVPGNTQTTEQTEMATPTVQPAISQATTTPPAPPIRPSEDELRRRLETVEQQIRKAKKQRCGVGAEKYQLSRLRDHAKTYGLEWLLQAVERIEADLGGIGMRTQRQSDV